MLGSSPQEREQRAREAIALEPYRQGKISLRVMGELAGVGGDYLAAENFRYEKNLPSSRLDLTEGFLILVQLESMRQDARKIDLAAFDQRSELPLTRRLLQPWHDHGLWVIIARARLALAPHFKHR